MTRLLPFPAASVGFFLIWLLLNQSLSPGHLILAALFAVAGGWLLARLDAPPLRLRRLDAALILIGRVAADILRSNINVTRLILMPRPGRRNGFVRLHLQLRSPYAVTALACILTATPGTSWVSFDPTDGEMLMHILDLTDDDDWGAIVKRRYEKLLMEIFE
jgi:multicomponent K+:H+ antiporter subunit E